MFCRSKNPSHRITRCEALLGGGASWKKKLKKGETALHFSVRVQYQLPSALRRIRPRHSKSHQSKRLSDPERKIFSEIASMQFSRHSLTHTAVSWKKSSVFSSLSLCCIVFFLLLLVGFQVDVTLVVPKVAEWCYHLMIGISEKELMW